MIPLTVEKEEGKKGSTDGPEDNPKETNGESKAKMGAHPTFLAELLFEVGAGVNGDAANVRAKTYSKDWRRIYVMEGWMRKKTMRRV